MRELITIAGVGVSVITSLIILVRMVYGQGKAKAREEGFLENLNRRDEEIKNSMNIIRNEISDINDKMDKAVLVQVAFANEMQGRVSRIEGKLNGIS